MLSPHYLLCDTIQSKLGVRHLDRIKANLTPKTFFHRRSGFHIDLNPNDPYQHTTTAIYYVNSNNGYTRFEDGTKVDSVGNRMVLFPSMTMHGGTTSTDSRYRMVINFVYY